jgi:hypothetical protein
MVAKAQEKAPKNIYFIATNKGIEMNISPMELFFSIFFSMVGIGYYSYGKKESLYFRLAGIILLTYPYFIDNVWLLGTLGILFMAMPFLLDRLFPLD